MSDRFHSYLLFSVLLLSLLFPMNSNSQEYNFIRYSLAEGLPQSQVYAMVEDQHGYLWTGTQGGGLARFDGREFEIFTRSDGLPSNYISALYEDTSGSLWIGTKKGLAVCRQDSFEIKAPFSRLERVSALMERGQDSLWIGSNKGVFLFDINRDTLMKMHLHPELDKSQVYQFLKTEAALYVTSNRGVWHFDGTRIEKMEALPKGEITSVALDTLHRLWIAHFTEGIFVLDASTHQEIDSLLFPDLKRIQYLYGTQDGQIWAGSQNNGIYQFQDENGLWENWNEHKGLPNNHIRVILEDSWKNVWMASSGGGIFRYSGKNFSHFTRADGLTDNRIYALLEDRDDRIWASTGYDGLVWMENDTIFPFIQGNDFLNVKAKTLFEDTQGRMWIGTEGKGVLVVDSTFVDTLNTEEGLPADWVRNITQDASGKIWLATHVNGVLHFHHDSMGVSNAKYIGRRQGLRDANITTLVPDMENRIWYATINGRVGFFNYRGVEQQFGRAEGLPSVSIRSLVFDDQNRLFIGTGGSGIYWSDWQADTVIFEKMAGDVALSSENIYSLSFDNEGRLWAGSESGVDRITFNASGWIMEVQHFGRNEGFAGIENCQNAILKDKNGSMWFGTLNGLMRYEQNEFKPSALPPKLYFTEISVLYEPLPESLYNDSNTLFSLPYNQNHLSFFYQSVDLSNPEGLEYRWQLEGLRNEWSPWSDEHKVSFGSLESRQYRFIVEARNRNFNASEQRSFSFVIQPPFWRTPSFLVPAILGFLILLAGIVTFQVRKFRQKESRKRKDLELKNQLLSLEQKALQLQMNPHFIFNALNAVQSLIATRDLQEARSGIHQFAQLMRSILANSRKQKINLKEEVDTLKLYLEMEQFCRPKPFTFIIQFPDNTDAEEVYLPPMLIQPFLENAVQHGIQGIAKEGEITVDFLIENELLVCEIKDNGIGYLQSKQQKKGKNSHRSMAIAVTKERLQAMAKEKYVAFQIEEIEEESQSTIAGTRVRLRLPLWMEF